MQNADSHCPAGRDEMYHSGKNLSNSAQLDCRRDAPTWEKILDTEIAKYFRHEPYAVREALQLLADQRLVEITPGRASRVTEIDSNQARSNYELMGHLNALALDLLHVQITDAFIEELCNSNRAMAAAIAQKDYPAIRAADRAFILLSSSWLTIHF